MDRDEAIRRVRLITPMLRNDVKTAVQSHAVMETSNDTIPKGMTGLHSKFTETYGAVQNALALKLAMDLARIFDLSDPVKRPAHKQDKASVLVLAALFNVDGVSSSLEDDAARWVTGVTQPTSTGRAHQDDVAAALSDVENKYRLQDRATCRTAILDFVALAERLGVDGTKEKAALGRVRDFRNRRLAHSLIDKAPEELPRYSDLHLLLEMALKAEKFASMAVEGHDADIADFAQRKRENSEGYASCVLGGLKLIADPQNPMA